MKRDFYQILGIGGDASSDEVKAAYQARFRALQKGPAPDQNEIAVLGEAYATLRDAEKRRVYDRFLLQQARDETRIFVHDRDAHLNRLEYGFYQDFFDAWERFGVQQKNIDTPIRLKDAFQIKARAVMRDIGSRIKINQIGNQISCALFAGAGLSYFAQLPPRSAELLNNNEWGWFFNAEFQMITHVPVALAAASGTMIAGLTLSPVFSSLAALGGNIAAKTGLALDDRGTNGVTRTSRIARITRRFGAAAYIATSLAVAGVAYDQARTFWMGALEGQPVSVNNFPTLK